MIRLPHMTGANHPRTAQRPCRVLISVWLGILFLALMAAVPLAATGVAREAAFQRQEARV